MRKLFVSRRLETDDNQVAWPNLFPGTGAFRAHIEIALRAANEDSLSPNGVIIRTQEKVCLLAGASQFCAIKAADSATANHRDFHSENGAKQSRAHRATPKLKLLR